MVFDNDSKRTHIKISPYLYVLPALIVVTTVSLYPIFGAIQLSVSDTHFTKVQGLAGLKHYGVILGTPAGRLYIKNSLIYTSARANS
ncbi:unnamed protein product, partial [marine sediment metagenome]